jgi:heme A synthase
LRIASIDPGKAIDNLWSVPPSAYDNRMLIHDVYGLVLTVVAAIGAIAAIGSLIRPQILPMVRVYLRITIAVVAVQVVIGIVLVATGDRPAQLIHWFYGAVTLLTLPLAIWLGGKLGGREQHVWLVGGAVLTVLFALRAMATG